MSQTLSPSIARCYRDFCNTITSTPDISLHRGKCRAGPILL